MNNYTAKTIDIDLSEIEQGIIKLDDRFGYIELPNDVDLKDAVDLSDYDYDMPYINIAISKRFNLETGELDKDDE